MTLELKRIRQHYRELLDGKTVALDRVTSNRPERILQGKLPAIGIHLRSVRWEKASTAPVVYLGRARFSFELYAEETLEQLDDLIDDFSEQVLALVLGDLHDGIPGVPEVDVNPDLSGLDTGETGYDSDGEAPLGAARHTVVVAFYKTAPTGPLSDLSELDVLETVGIDWDFPPPDQELDAQDEVGIPQS